jgi:RNA 2',3'-cyclic 3'-phosphodiesterase
MNDIAPDPVQQARPTDSLFFALYPDEAAAARITDLAARLRSDHALNANAIPADRLHITLHYLGAFDGLPADVIERAQHAASAIALPPVEIALSRIESFHSRRAKRPLVLAGDASESLLALESALRSALDAAGVATKRGAHFTPHVTLLYDEHRIAPHEVPPVTLRARDFALVRSFLGKSRHEVIARWPLTP